MNRKIKPVIVILIISYAATLFLFDERRAESSQAVFNIASIQSYHEIPGVTAEEIAAIEALKSDKNRQFSYGMMLTSESFTLPDGSKAGFSVHFCKLLSDLFGIPFVLDLYTWDVMKPGLDNRSIDFTGGFTATPERRQVYHMTSPIAQRSIEVYFNDETLIRIESEESLNGLRIGFLSGTITEQSVRYYYPALDFDVKEVKDISDAAEKLKSGEIDAFIVDAPATHTFVSYKFIKSASVLPLVFTPISMTTANPELAPVISVVNKYLAVGGSKKLDELYAAGEQEYKKYELSESLSQEEKDWLNNLMANKKKVPIVLQKTNYPISFYNEQDKEYQGIAIDILSEISALTGIEYEIKSNRNTSWEEMLSMLATGEASLVSELLHSDNREDSFLWAEQPYLTFQYILLSKSSYPNLKMYQVMNSTVGILKGSVAVEKFATWFPDSKNVRLYATVTEALDALENDEINLFMASTHILLAQTNYREKLGYKANIILPALNESLFGFNKNEPILCSIIDKAHPFVNTKDIVRDWASRVYDYSRKMSETRSFFLLIIAVGLCLGLAGMCVTFFMFMNKNKMIVKQAALLNALYEASPDLIVSKDLDGRYTSCNNFFKEFLGRPESEIIGKTSQEVLEGREEMLLKFDESDQVILGGKEIVRVEDVYLFPDGSQRLFELVKIPVKEHGKLTGLMGVSRDITAHKVAIEAAQKASKSKSDFLARMSHEIRTPMNAVIGLAELALREKHPGTFYEHVATIRQTGINLMSVINDILDFSKIEQGKLEILPNRYLFSSLVNDVVSIIRMRVIDSPILFVVNIDSNLPNKLIGDEIKLRQVLLNLLSNAVKYTNTGFVSLTIYGEVTDDASVNLTIEVADSGKGIKPEDIEYIFGEYMQSDQGKNKYIEGTGLGLAITRSIVKAMDGEISVCSEYKKGSIFTVKLPQKIRKPSRLASVENSKSALIFEPRDVYANSIAYSVRNLGVECTLAQNEADMFMELEMKKYDVIFVSSSLYEQNKGRIIGSTTTSKVVLLTKFGEAISNKDLKILSMPTYCIPIANVLNEESQDFSFSENNEETAHFTAPDARILIVDDSATNLKVAEGLIAPYKMQIDTCKNGLEAIDTIKNERYDLILMDHKMPEMDGVEATQRIRAMGAEDDYFQKVPIVALTANASSEIKAMFLANGFNDYLPKPIDISKLNGMLSRWIPSDMQNKSIRRNDIIKTEKKQNGYAIFGIEGLDAGLGIVRSGGTIKLFQETLAVFLKDGAEKIAEIRNSLEIGDLRMYSIYTHALKSALANIGATRLSELARELELAGAHGDADSIEKQNPVFLSNLETLLNRISGMLNEAVSQNPEGTNFF